MGILLAWNNLADAAVSNMVVSSEAQGLGLRSMTTPQISDVWRSGAWLASTINLRVDLAADKAVNLVAIAAPRDGLLPSSGATVRLTASSLTQDGTERLDTGVVSLGDAMATYGIFAWAAASAISARYFRFQFTGGGADSYLQLGRLWIGPALITGRNAGYGYAAGATDPGASMRAGVSGVRDVQRGRAYRQLRFTHETLTAAEAEQVELAGMAVGTTGQVFGARVHTAPRAGCFGNLSKVPDVVRASHLLWRADFSIDEDL